MLVYVSINIDIKSIYDYNVCFEWPLIGFLAFKREWMQYMTDKELNIEIVCDICNSDEL